MVFDMLYADCPSFWELGFQDPATPIAEAILSLHHDIAFFLIIICTLTCSMLFQVLANFTEIGLPASMAKQHALCYRPSKRYHNTLIEIVWTVLPTIILLMIGIPSFALLYAMDELIDPVLTVKVIGRQWYWSYEYNDNPNAGLEVLFDEFDSYISLDSYFAGYDGFRLLDTDYSLVLPMRQHVRLLITSSDVLHSWAVPAFGIKLDACPGRLNQTSVFGKREGVFYGQCSEICGVNHAFMPIRVVMVELDRFAFHIECGLAQDASMNHSDVAYFMEQRNRL